MSWIDTFTELRQYVEEFKVSFAAGIPSADGPTMVSSITVQILFDYIDAVDRLNEMHTDTININMSTINLYKAGVIDLGEQLKVMRARADKAEAQLYACHDAMEKAGMFDDMSKLETLDPKTD
jgi:hypothetical protein